MAGSIITRMVTPVSSLPVDRFSEAAHFVPLPSAKERAELLINHVFRIDSLPMDVVSDSSE